MSKWVSTEVFIQVRVGVEWWNSWVKFRRKVEGWWVIWGESLLSVWGKWKNCEGVNKSWLDMSERMAWMLMMYVMLQGACVCNFPLLFLWIFHFIFVMYDVEFTDDVRYDRSILMHRIRDLQNNFHSYPFSIFFLICFIVWMMQVVYAWMAGELLVQNSCARWRPFSLAFSFQFFCMLTLCMWTYCCMDVCCNINALQSNSCVINTHLKLTKFIFSSSFPFELYFVICMYGMVLMEWCTFF